MAFTEELTGAEEQRYDLLRLRKNIREKILTDLDAAMPLFDFKLERNAWNDEEVLDEVRGHLIKMRTAIVGALCRLDDIIDENG